MGCVIIAVAMIGVAPIYFPMWGGLLCGPKKDVTEEDYYFSEYTPAERKAGHHLASSAFVSPPVVSAYRRLPIAASLKAWQMLRSHIFTALPAALLPVMDDGGQ